MGVAEVRGGEQDLHDGLGVIELLRCDAHLGQRPAAHEVARWPIEGGDQHADGVSVGWSVEVVHDVNVSPTRLVCFDIARAARDFEQRGL